MAKHARFVSNEDDK